MNDIVLKTNFELMTDDDVLTAYVLTQKLIPLFEIKLWNELDKRNITEKSISLDDKVFRVSKNPDTKKMSVKANDIKKILIHCLKNQIDGVFDNITIKQGWLDKQKWYDNSFFNWQEKETKTIRKFSVADITPKLGG